MVGVSSRQRLAAVIALVVLLAAVGYALVPFRPEGASRACGPAALDAFRSSRVPRAGDRQARWEVGDSIVARRYVTCSVSARSRLVTSSVVAVLAVVGGLASVRILQEPPPA